MKAAVYERSGPASEVLKLVELPDPEPGPGEVRVRLALSGVNPTDWQARSGSRQPHGSAQIPHQDGAGMIDQVGPGVGPERIGERVWVYHAAYKRSGGTAAQFLCLPEEQAVVLPDSASLEQGAGLGIPYMTAHRCVFADGPVAGKTLLITGGAGAVGNAAIQLARQGGANVISTVSCTYKAELAASAGSQLVLDYHAPDFAQQLKTAAPKGIERVVDVALGANLHTYVERLSLHAAVVAYAVLEQDPTIPLRRLVMGNIMLRFVLVYELTKSMIKDAVAFITQALAAGDLTPLPTHQYPLEEIAAAQDAVQAGVIGKVLLAIPR